MAVRGKGGGEREWVARWIVLILWGRESRWDSRAKGGVLPQVEPCSHTASARQGQWRLRRPKFAGQSQHGMRSGTDCAATKPTFLADVTSVLVVLAGPQQRRQCWQRMWQC
jgi:hypothetical protein